MGTPSGHKMRSHVHSSLFSSDVLLVVGYMCGWVWATLTPFLSMDVHAIFVAVRPRQVGHGETDIKAFQGFTHDFQHIRFTATLPKYVVSSPVCPDRLRFPPNLLSLPGVKRPEREADNSPQSSAKIQYECCLTTLSVAKIL